MKWEKLLNTKRLGNREAKAEIGRSPFNSDHDKIIFSGAFRRLAKKTQVHPLATNDHVHNRLTHSLEVACVGRSLGIKVGQALADNKRLPTGFLPTDLGDIVQSACLAHDIGNPPFGHTGEEAIRNWFKYDGKDYLSSLKPEEQSDFLLFEGNAQGLRILTSSEYHPYDGGMRLTYATLASFIKYPWTSQPTFERKRPKHNKYGVFQSELKVFEEIALAVGLDKREDDDSHWYCRHPLAYLMEAADDFCYGIIDLEDGLEMGILEWDEIYNLLKPALDKSRISSLEIELGTVCKRGKPALIRGEIISAYIDAAATAFIECEDEVFQGKPSDLISLCPQNIKNSVENAKKLAKDKIFSHPRKIEIEIGSYHVISTLLDIMCAAADEFTTNSSKMSYRSQRVIKLIDEDTFYPDTKNNPKKKYLAMMRVIDFISGMTDHYATYLAKQFNGMGQSR